MSLYGKITDKINATYPENGQGATSIARTKLGWQLICAEIEAIKEKMGMDDGNSNEVKP